MKKVSSSFKRVGTIALTPVMAVMLLLAISLPIMAAGLQSEDQGNAPGLPSSAKILNLPHKSIGWPPSWNPRWSDTQTSYLFVNSDHRLSLLNASSEDIHVVTLDKDYQLLNQQRIELELPIFGTFYSGEDYNFIAFGQINREEDDSKEVIRIVRYDKEFRRIDSVSIYGGESHTITPFDAGCGKMAQSGNELTFHTSRLCYTTKDGLNHQTSITITLDIPSMTVKKKLESFVSHSFNQFVAYDGVTRILVDHGDAYPRSVVMHISSNSSSGYRELDLFPIPGKIGANATGVSVGGLAVSDTAYLVAMNSVDHSQVLEYTNYDLVGLPADQRDIILCVVPKNGSAGQIRQVTLASYTDSSFITTVPSLLPISGNKFMVLWEEFSLKESSWSWGDKTQGGDVCYVYVDAQGQALGPIERLKNYRLSACQPILYNNTVVWPQSANDKLIFNRFSTLDMEYIAGQNRVLTAVAVSQQGWQSAESVILASGNDANLVDALAAASLAGQENAPILLSINQQLDPAVIAEIQRLGARHIFAVGALSPALLEQLSIRLPGVEVELLQGATRIETAQKINARIKNPQGIFLVGFNALADAISAAPYAAAHRYLIQPVNADGSVTVADGQGSLSEGGGIDVLSLPTENKYILGGPAMVRDQSGFTRIAGIDRYDTNGLLRQALDFSDDVIYAASGQTLVDALTGSVLAAQTQSPIVLMPAGGLVDTEFGGIRENTKLRAFGGKRE
ncbi:Dockerin type I repeat protein [Desulfitobacterium hafniense]|uniref:Dockerin type I repeat protein n=1 Tax=Desulfitobacterium hafniense TaxID=49338 RepID=A0A098B9A0_DESHA|nr:cell wall-binding repeat-containing protein [Desulfitobacterium hafniense]CDX04942.1 Dockerin type I repeat protein [Desulfitobacterium hafniense]